MILTGFLVEVHSVIVGTSQLPHDLPIILVFGQPAVAGEAEGLVHGIVLHVNVL